LGQTLTRLTSGHHGTIMAHPANVQNYIPHSNFSKKENFVSLFQGGCERVLINPYIYMPICILYVLMILTSFIISAIIYFIARASTKSEARQRTKLFHRLFFLFSSTLWTFFTCLPYRILYLLNMICASCRTEFVHQMTDTFFRILVVGMVINPLITIGTQRIYRARLLRFFTRWQASVTSDETLAMKWNTVESAPLTTTL
uniref:G_PROTEIN_RECEP_F1_2 domain-containing protein n=1 Tax=Angiostrongylus cantonensis TaxID=6313 RepID=A0A0K0DPQ7_ANGCA